MSIRAGLRPMARSSGFLQFFRRSHTIIGSAVGAQTDYQSNIELDIFSAYPANAGAAQTTPTSDGSGQCVHPSILYFPEGWNGYKYWMAMTPFPGNDDNLETPEILACDDGVNWVVPAGLTNPIVARDVAAPNTDSFLFYNEATDELWCYYRKTDVATYDRIYLKKSVDGIEWGGTGLGTLVLDMALAAALSPAVIKVGATYHMWYVDRTTAPNAIKYRTSVDGETWGVEGTINLYGDMPWFSVANDWMPWHLEVRWINEYNEYWMPLTLTNAEVGWGTDNQLMFLRSTDGINWYLHPNIILSPSAAGWDSSRSYKATFILDGSTLKIWYSGCEGTPVWGVGYTEATLDLDFLDMFRKIRTDGGDLRFTDDTLTSLPYWFENFSWGGYASIWVKVPTIPAAPDSAIIYVYYGNAAATSESSGADTFETFDDFEDGDVTDWTVESGGLSGTWAASLTYSKRGSYSGKFTQNVGFGLGLVLTKGITPALGRCLIFDFRDDAAIVSGGCLSGLKNQEADNIWAQTGWWSGDSAIKYTARWRVFGWASVLSTVTRTTNWHKMQVYVDQDGDIMFMLDDEAAIGETANIFTVASPPWEIVIDGIDPGGVNPPFNNYFDDFRLRKYVDPEPTHGAWGIERRTRWPF